VKWDITETTQIKVGHTHVAIANDERNSFDMICYTVSVRLSNDNYISVYKFRHASLYEDDIPNGLPFEDNYFGALPVRKGVDHLWLDEFADVSNGPAKSYVWRRDKIKAAWQRRWPNLVVFDSA